MRQFDREVVASGVVIRLICLLDINDRGTKLPDAFVED
jgi:hypothetical protein